MRIQSVVVGAIVSDVQLTIAVNHREVAATVDATGMLSADSNEVAMVDIVDGRSRVAKHRCSVGIGLIAVRRHIATRKHGIVDDDATFDIVFFVEQFCPFSCPLTFTVFSSLQSVQIVCRHIFVCLVSLVTMGYSISGSHLQVG